MAITLVINPGSTSKKYAFYADGKCCLTLRYEKTGEGFGVCREKNGEQQKCESVSASTYKKALEHALTAATEASFIGKERPVTKVGVRIVAPGTYFSEHRLLTDEYITKLEAQQELAPQHVPTMLDEIYAVRSQTRHAALYAISDSAFHSTIPEHRRQFAIPVHEAKDFDIKRFGYHGLSMASIARRSPAVFKSTPKRQVVCHVGGGVSVTALLDGVSIDTSMGFSPASGVMMGSRVGALEADALLALMQQRSSRNPEKLLPYLSQDCGFAGLTGVSDLRLVLNQAAGGRAEAAQALQTFRYQLQRQIGGHIALLGGLDALVFTGTAVVRNPYLRAYVLEGVEHFGLTLSDEINDTLMGNDGLIHAPESAVQIGVIRNDEMGEIERAVEVLASTNQ